MPTSDQPDLFNVGERIPQPGQFGASNSKKQSPCVPAPIGSGPKGETCGTCKHLYRNQLAKTYLKCGLMRRFWSGGGGTDIKAKWAACSKWEAGT